MKFGEIGVYDTCWGTLPPPAERWQHRNKTKPNSSDLLLTYDKITQDDLTWRSDVLSVVCWTEENLFDFWVPIFIILHLTSGENQSYLETTGDTTH